jgi:hypothetical protein
MRSNKGPEILLNYFAICGGVQEQARRWLRPETSVDPIAMRGTGDRDTSWISWLELEILRREASAMIEPIDP